MKTNEVSYEMNTMNYLAGLNMESYEIYRQLAFMMSNKESLTKDEVEMIGLMLQLFKVIGSLISEIDDLNEELSF